ncbi:cactin-like isoform X1 [Senna tora]|uniref:Splicing factor Cactin n=1 Tax=Senna tora TaxID=362788 RepID=A0A834SIT0_9FABA|nr:cactin-like isoform X1 [Senna tora]
MILNQKHFPCPMSQTAANLRRKGVLTNAGEVVIVVATVVVDHGRRNSSGKHDSDSYASDDSDDRFHRKKKSSRTITEEEIAEYMAKKPRERFVWRKKIERDVVQGVPLDTFQSKLRKRGREKGCFLDVMSRAAEIEKVKKRREERALEKAQHEEEMAILARERARAEFQDWEKKEEEFHFDQSKVRSEIRLREGRARPIDILTKHLSGSDDLDIEINEPYMVFKGLTVKEMEELRDDIKMHLDLDRETPTHVEYWEDALDRARVRGEEPPAELRAEERGLHYSVEAEVKNLLQGKTCAELEAMRINIESQMRSGTAKVVEYWEAVLKRLHIYKAKASLKEIHAKMLRKHLQRLEQPLEGEDILEDAYDIKPVEEDTDNDVKVQSADEPLSPEPMRGEDQEAEDEAGSFSPELLHGDENEEAIDPEEDRAILERKRMAAMKAMGAMEEGDAVFGSGAEVNLDSQVYWWHDKYRPRKPKYFNRVHTGYEWNKYNQTHYDHDNPPPKIVQGYKFNIFYPDLVDKTKAPTYTIEKDGSNGETCIIRFHAGPPYEDIAAGLPPQVPTPAELAAGTLAVGDTGLPHRKSRLREDRDFPSIASPLFLGTLFHGTGATLLLRGALDGVSGHSRWLCSCQRWPELTGGSGDLLCDALAASSGQFRRPSASVRGGSPVTVAGIGFLLLIADFGGFQGLRATSCSGLCGLGSRLSGGHNTVIIGLVCGVTGLSRAFWEDHKGVRDGERRKNIKAEHGARTKEQGNSTTFTKVLRIFLDDGGTRRVQWVLRRHEEDKDSKKSIAARPLTVARQVKNDGRLVCWVPRVQNQGRQDPSTQRTGVQRALGRREVGIQTEETEMVTLDVGNGGIGNKGGGGRQA